MCASIASGSLSRDDSVMTKAPKPNLDETTLQIARRMLSMPPKPHEDMKIGKRKRESAKSLKRRRVVKKTAR